MCSGVGAVSGTFTEVPKTIPLLPLALGGQYRAKMPRLPPSGRPS